MTRLEEINNILSALVDEKNKLESLEMIEKNSKTIGKYYKKKITPYELPEDIWYQYFKVTNIDKDEGWINGVSFETDWSKRITIQENDVLRSIDDFEEITQNEFEEKLGILMNGISYIGFKKENSRCKHGYSDRNRCPFCVNYEKYVRFHTL